MQTGILKKKRCRSIEERLPLKLLLAFKKILNIRKISQIESEL